MRTRTSQAGFTLIEVFIIFVVLAAVGFVGYPKYVEMMVKARQSEAKNNLAFLYTLERTYFKAHNTYVDMKRVTPENCGKHKNRLGFRPADCEQGRYAYWVKNADRETFSGHASSVRSLWDGCDMTDHWMIDEKKSVTAKNDVTAGPQPCAF